MSNLARTYLLWCAAAACPSFGAALAEGVEGLGSCAPQMLFNSRDGWTMHPALGVRTNRLVKFGTFAITGEVREVDGLSADPPHVAALRRRLVAVSAENAELKRKLSLQGERVKAAESAGAAARKTIVRLEKALANLEKRVAAAQAIADKWKEVAVKSDRREAEGKNKLAAVTGRLKNADTRIARYKATTQKADTELTKWKADARKAQKKLREIEAVRKKAPAWTDKANWRKLSVGMEAKKVRGILGDPGKVFTTSVGGKPRVVWYYPSVFGGSVELEEDKLRSWKEP